MICQNIDAPSTMFAKCSPSSVISDSASHKDAAISSDRSMSAFSIINFIVLSSEIAVFFVQFGSEGEVSDCVNDAVIVPPIC